MVKNKFIAKSAGKNGQQPETIQEHTNAVLKEYKRFYELYGDYINGNQKPINEDDNNDNNGENLCDIIDWELLEKACLYHDLGKMNREFQEKICNGEKSDTEIPHGVLSTLFLNPEGLNSIVEKERAKILYSAIYYHHDRESLESENVKELIDDRLKFDENKTLRKELQKEADKFQYDRLRIGENKLKVFGYKENFISRFTKSEEKPLLPKYIMLKGLLNRMDYAASAHIEVEHKNDFLENCLEDFMETLKAKASTNNREDKSEPQWNELQNYMKENQNNSVVVIAQTGMGKTEAGLWWIGNHKGFFTLPIRTAINAIYSRIKNDIVKEKVEERIGLLHSETKGYYIKESLDKNVNGKNAGSLKSYVNWAEYYVSTKQLSLPLTVCTLDQLFTFVFKYRGYEAKLATLSYSKVIIDEIQMYGPDIIGFMLCGLKMIQKMGGKFAILTATFPGFLREIMEEKGIKFQMPDKPFVDNKIVRHSVELHKEPINSKFIVEHCEGKRVLVICNTVKQCQKMYEEITNTFGTDDYAKDKQGYEVNLFHGKFIHKDRNQKEKAILEFGRLYDENGNQNDKEGIWIANTVAEASLDIDFDLIITELSEINGLFQRFGRCYRKRHWHGEGCNCHVFDGGDSECSGVGYNIDKDIFALSKSYLRKYFESNCSCLNEETKMNIVANLYTLENLQNTNYYQIISDCIEQPDLYLPGEKSSTEAQGLFRNICSVTMIPSTIYEENKTTIENLVNDITGESIGYEERIIKKEELKKYTLDVEKYQMEGIDYNKTKSFYLGEFEQIYVINSEYDSEMGLKRIIKRTGAPESNII